MGFFWPEYTTSGEPFYAMCPPCSEVRHEDCWGSAIFCACLAEILMEAEEISE